MKTKTLRSAWLEIASGYEKYARKSGKKTDERWAFGMCCAIQKGAFPGKLKIRMYEQIHAELDRRGLNVSNYLFPTGPKFALMRAKAARQFARLKKPMRNFETGALNVIHVLVSLANPENQKK